MGTLFQKPTQKQSVSESFASLRYSVVSMKGWRKFMEDVPLAIHPYANNPEMSLFAIFDGHGGPEAAIFLKQTLPDWLLKNPHFLSNNYEKSLKQTFLQIDNFMASKEGEERLKQIRFENSQINNATFYEGNSISGTTATVILLTKDFVYCANSGDCRALACMKNKQGNERIQQLSFDHKPYVTRQLQRIIKAGGTVSEDGRVNKDLNLSRAFGDFKYKKNMLLSPQEQIITVAPDIVKIQRKDVDFMIIGCDGIWQTKNNSQMIKFINKKRISHNGNLTKVIQQLLDSQIGDGVYTKKGTDNMTAILIQLNSP